MRKHIGAPAALMKPYPREEKQGRDVLRIA